MSRHLPLVRLPFFCLPIIIALQLFASRATGQATNPAPVALPYVQNFSTFSGSTSTYPAGFQGWTVTGSLSTTVLTGAPASNQSLYSGEDNATSVPYIADLVQKIGMLPASTSGTSVNALCLAINTTSVTTDSVQVIYTVGTQGQTASGFIDELDLQYRIGTTGSFTTIAGATYRNTATTTTTTAGITTATNDSTRYILLPSSCNGKAVVQLRWIMRNVSGLGTIHPSFSISNIAVQQNATTDYYSKSTGNLDAVATWGMNRDGSGTAPANFTANAQVFHISNGNPGSIGASHWTVSGTNSEIIVDGTNFTNTTSKTVNGTISVNAGMTLTLSNSSLPTLDSLDPLSTVVFANLTSIVMPTPVSVSGAYGNITFNNSSVALPSTTQSVVFAGNFTLLNSASFVGSVFLTEDNSNGYSLVSYGNYNQVINANGLPLDTWTFDVGNTNPKNFGYVALASNTNLNIENTAVMILNGAITAPQFIDSGNTITVTNNLDFSGTPDAYSFTGTIYLSGPSYESGAQVIRGGTTAPNPNVAVLNNLVLNNALTAKIDGNLTVKGNLIITDTATSILDFQSNTLYLGGNFISRNTTDLISTTAGGQLVFDGTAMQSYTSAVPGGNSFNQVTMNNGAGLTLNSPMNITNTGDTLYLVNGIIYAGANSLNIDNKGSVKDANPSSYIKGNLRKAMLATGSTSMIYEIGDTSYSPIKLTFSSSVNTGTITATSTYGAHPAIGSSYINTSNFVDRYWTISSAGVSPTSVNLELSYNSGDITGVSNSNYIIRKYASGVWSATPLPVTNTTTASTPMQPYASITNGITGSAFSGDYIAGTANCTTTAGTTNPAPAAICPGGSSTLSLSGATTNPGNTYQWESSATGSSYTAISGATNSTFTATVSATTYYECVVGCIATNGTLSAVSAILTVNPLPSAILGNHSNCVGSSIALSDASTGGSWSSSNTAIVTIGSSSGSYTGSAAGSALITYTLPTGCNTATTVNINPVPVTPVTTPLALSFCSATPAELSATVSSYAAYTGSVTATYTASSPVINSTVIDTASVMVSGIPSGATITSISVFVNIAGQSGAFQRDNIFNLRAPNNAIINLLNKTGGATGSMGFPNIDISSAGTTPMVSGTTLVPGTVYEANLSGSSVGPATPIGYKSGAGYNWSNVGVGSSGNGSLYNGNWTFIQYDQYPEDTFKSFTVNISYVVNTNVTWAPVTGLYTNTGGVGPAYTGASATSVYVLPTATTIYTVTAAVGACSSSATMPAFFNNPLYVPSVQGPSVLCQGGTAAMTDSASGGVWSSVGSASVSATGVVTGLTAGTAIISFGLSNGCAIQYATKVVTVNSTSIGPITGITNLCLGGTASATLSDATTGGTWSTGSANITVGSSNGMVNALSIGTATVSYILSSGCLVTTPITVTGSPSITATALPNPICSGGTIAFTSTPSGGSGTYSSFTWNGPVALSAAQNPYLVNITTSANGVYTVTVTDNTGCSASGVTAAVTVNASPVITASVTPNPVCAGNTLSFSATPSGGSGSYAGYSWSGPVSLSSVQNPNITSAAIADNGIYTVTVTDNNGCTATASTMAVTVNASPVITASVTANPICAGGSLSFNALPTGGSGVYNSYVWSGPAILSSVKNPFLTNVTIADNGVYSVTVTDNNGCSGLAATAAVTVNSLPGITAVASPNPICAGATLSLNSTPAGGSGVYTNYVWSGAGAAPATMNTAILNTTISDGGSYTVTVIDNNGCSGFGVTASVTVNPLPQVISGVDSVCVGSTTLLSDLNSGTWSSNNTNVTIGSGSGLVAGVGAGTSLVSFTSPAGCSVTTVVTVNSLPSAIYDASTELAVGYTITLSDTTAGGAWSSDNANSSVSSAGVVTGLVVGSSYISYTLPSGCSTSIEVTVNANPPIYGIRSVCIGANTMLTDAVTGGTWSSSNSNVSVGSSGTVTGEHAGTSVITYTFPSTLVTTVVVTVNPFPNVISGADSVCPGITITLTDVGGGTWSSSNSNVFIGSSSVGAITGVISGTSIITYTLPTGCMATTLVTINNAPTVIGGNSAVCIGLSTYLTDGITGGSWSTASTNVTVGSASGMVSGTSAGTAVVSYTTSSGCVTGTIVTVNSYPSAIFGATTLVAVTSFITLSDTSGTGSWSSSNTNTSVNSSGTVTGLAVGTSVITYTETTGCTATIIVTVNSTPPINGNMVVCAGATTTLTDIFTGGTWASSNLNVMVSSAGIVTGEAAGTSIVTYTFPSSLTVAAVITVNPLPARITGDSAVCVGADIILSDAGTGTWSSSSTVVATVSSGGSVSGVSSGTSVITYTLPTGCITTGIITVNSLIAPSVSLMPASGDTVCSGVDVAFTASAINGGLTPAYEWQVNGIPAAATSNTYSYMPVNGDVVSVTLMSSASCATPASASAFDTMVVIHSDTAMISISAMPSGPICMGSPVLVTSSSVNVGSNPVYIWFKNGIEQSDTNSSFAYVPANNDDLYCQLVSAGRCVAQDTATSNHIVMVVDSSFVPSVNILASQGNILQPEEIDTFTAVVTNGGPSVSYQWFINYSFIPGATTNTLVWSGFSNNDSVSCLVTSMGSCGYSSFNSLIIHILPEAVQQLPALASVKLLPNPNKGQFILKGSIGVADAQVSVEITDMIGQVIYKNNFLASGGNINEPVVMANALANGMYILNLISGTERQTFHFVVEQ